MEGIDVEYFPVSIDPGINEKQISFIYEWWQWTRYMWLKCSYFSYIKKIIELGILVSGMLKVWKYTDGCAKKYRSYLDMYLMTVL